MLNGIGFIDRDDIVMDLTEPPRTRSSRRYCVMKGRALGRVRLDGHVAGPRKCCKDDEGDW